MEADAKHDILTLIVGVGIVFIYVWLTMGKKLCDAIENRIWLSMMGIAAVGMGVSTAYGVCQLFGIYSTTMHKVLPFLLLGIGIDDMFVIVQTFQRINDFYQDGYVCMLKSQN